MTRVKELYKRQYDILTKKLLTENTLYKTSGKLPAFDVLYEDFKNNEILYYDTIMEHTPTSEKILNIKLHLISHIEETTQQVYNVISESYETIPYTINEKILLTEDVLQSYINPNIPYIQKHYNIEEASFTRYLGHAVGFGLSTWAMWSLKVAGIIGGALAGSAAIGIPLGLYVAFAYLFPYTTKEKVKQSIKSLALILADIVNGIFMLPDPKQTEKLNILLDNIHLNPEIKKMFEKDGDIQANINTIADYCNTLIDRKARTELHKKINVKNYSVIKKLWYSFTMSLFGGHNPEKLLLQYRKCVLSRLIDLYKILFLGLFVKYTEYEHTKKLISTNYSTKMLFTYFKNMSNIDESFRKSFETMVKLRNLLDTYKNLIKQVNDMDDLYKQELVKFIDEEIKKADKDLEFAIKKNIDRLELQKAKELFTNKIEGMEEIRLRPKNNGGNNRNDNRGSENNRQ